MLTKKEIRNAVLAERKAIDEETAALASQVICRKVMGIDLYEEADNICLYMPINNEVDVMLLADAAEESGKKVWLPKVVQKQKKGEAGIMVFNRYEGKNSMTSGEYGIMESTSEEILDFGDETENILIIMPGAAFTPWKDRIGYGGGFYDRFLAEYPQCGTIAVGYDLQIVPEIPTEECDIRPDYVVCETSIFR